MTKFSTNYSLIKSQVFIPDYGEVTTYGLQTTNLPDNIFIKDISTKLDNVKNLINLCNNYCVSTIILEDILEDYIS